MTLDATWLCDSTLIVLHTFSPFVACVVLWQRPTLKNIELYKDNAKLLVKHNHSNFFNAHCIIFTIVYLSSPVIVIARSSSAYPSLFCCSKMLSTTRHHKIGDNAPSSGQPCLAKALISSVGDSSDWIFLHVAWSLFNEWIDPNFQSRILEGSFPNINRK